MRTTVLNMPAASGILYNGSGCLTLHASRETTGTTAAVYQLWDGASNQGTLIVPVSLSASESTRDFFPSHLVPFKTGLYFELVSGTIEGAIGICFEHECDNVLAMMIDAWHAQGT